jgi:hypothetical protein
MLGDSAYSREACIRGIDEFENQRKDPENFDPIVDVRDYESISQSLHVYCASSLAYQKLQGRYAKDADVLGFDDVRETEIPAIRDHAIQLTIKPRTASCDLFLVGLCKLANSMVLCAHTCETGNEAVSRMSAKREGKLNDSLKKLEQVRIARSAQCIDESLR